MLVYILRYLYVSHQQNATIAFAIHPTSDNHLWICQCQKGFLKYPNTMLDIHVGAAVYLDDGKTKT